MDIQQNQVSEEVQETATPAKKVSVGRIVLLVITALLVLLGTIVRPSYVTALVLVESPVLVYLGLFAVAGIIAVIVSMFLNEKVGKLVKVIGLAATALGFLFLTIGTFPLAVAWWNGISGDGAMVYAIMGMGTPLSFLFVFLMFAMVALKAQFGFKLNALVVLFIVLGAISLSFSASLDSMFFVMGENFYFAGSMLIAIAEFVLLFVTAKKLSK